MGLYTEKKWATWKFDMPYTGTPGAGGEGSWSIDTEPTFGYLYEDTNWAKEDDATSVFGTWRVGGTIGPDSIYLNWWEQARVVPINTGTIDLASKFYPHEDDERAFSSVVVAQGGRDALTVKCFGIASDATPVTGSDKGVYEQEREEVYKLSIDDTITLSVAGEPVKPISWTVFGGIGSIIESEDPEEEDEYTAAVFTAARVGNGYVLLQDKNMAKTRVYIIVEEASE